MITKLNFVIFSIGVCFILGSCSPHSSSVPEIIPPEPFTYFPISFYGPNIELLAKIDTATHITFINHLDGSVSETMTSKTGRRNDEYRGQYFFTSLKSPPQWSSTENYIQKVSSITALVGVPFSEVQVIYPNELDDLDLAEDLDSQIRKYALLDSAINSMMTKEELAKEYLNSLEGKLPKLAQIEFSDRKVTLISYQLSSFSGGSGPQMLAIGDNIIPLKGSCGSRPHFYSIGGHLYFRLLSSVCETGFILVGNYVVLSNTIQLEWETSDYAN